MTAESQPGITPDDRLAGDREYGARIVAVEPGGNERVPDAERHGRPRQLFWTWASPNLEFATIFLGVLAVSAFGLTFWQAVAAVVLGNGMAALAHGVLSARGPEGGVPQMVLGRLAFGYRGNVVPSALMTITSGFGWFAVNSVSASFALASLTGLSAALWLVVVVLAQVVVAFFGHNLVVVYWVGPWLGVVLTDQYLRRRIPVELLYDRSYANPAGLIALLAGIVVSVGLFSNQELFTGLVPRLLPGVGDVTFLMGMMVSAGLYAVLLRRSMSG